jgi:hypothetical protein
LIILLYFVSGWDGRTDGRKKVVKSCNKAEEKQSGDYGNFFFSKYFRGSAIFNLRSISCFSIDSEPIFCNPLRLPRRGGLVSSLTSFIQVNLAGRGLGLRPK